MTNTPHARFLALHDADRPFMLPNAWDAASAKLFDSSGAPAVATSSAAVAWALGYPDGSALPTDELLGAVRRITRVLKVPLTVDIEDGYSDSPETVAALARRIADAGAVGINIEDGSKAPQLLADKIRAIRAALPANALFVNARTDVYLRGLAPTAEAVAMTIERLHLYAEAGTDVIFVPGLAALPETREIAAAVNKPLNLMLIPHLPAVDALHAAGVRRISAGPAPFRVAYDAANRAVGAFMQGDFEPMAAARLDFRTLNGLFSDSH